MRNIRGIALAALVLLAPTGARAGIDKAGTTAAGFLTVGAGADVLGMGGTTLGFGNGLGSAAWNVASLGTLRGTEYVFAHASMTGESPQDWVALGGRFGASRTRWGMTGLYQGDGSFEGRDALNNPTASFNASSMAIGFQVAQPVGPAALVGVGLKYASEKLGDVTGGGVTFDGGVRVRAGSFGFGAAAQNAFGKMTYDGVKYEFPTNYGAGVSYSIPLTGVTFAMDANFPNAYYSDVRTGVEWRYRDRLALRTGYRKELGAEEGEPLGGPTFGMGAGANGFWVDYGFLTGGASGSGQHRVGLTYRPGFMNDGDDDLAAEHPAREAKMARAQPTYVERAKAARSLSPPAPKLAPEQSRAPEGVAAPAPVPAAAPKTVAPATTSRSSIPVRDPATPVVAAPAPIKPAPVKTGETPKPAAVKPEVPPAVVEAPKPAPASIAPAPAKVEVAPAKVAPAPAKVEEPAKVAPAPAKVEEPAKPAPVPAKVEAPPAKVEEPAKPAPAPAKVEEPAKPAPAPAKAEEPAKPTVRPDKVKVKSGQTLADIAKEWGNTVPALMMENNMVSEKVKSGQVIKLPAKGR